MTTLFFSTVFRYAPNDQAGELVKLDWKKKEILKRVPVGPKTLRIDDPNPRGNSRGGRGIALVDNKIIMAGFCELQIYDQDLNHLSNITHNLMAGLHEVFLDSGKTMWITSTNLGCALQFNIETGDLVNQLWPQETPEFQSRWSLVPLDINKKADNRLLSLSKNFGKDASHLHFNAITVWNGQEFGLFNRFGAVVNLSTHRVVLEDPSIKGAHNLIILDDGTIFVNDTRNQGVNLYNMDGNLIKRIDLLPFHPAGRKVKRYKQFAPIRGFLENRGLIQESAVMPFFVRGMDLRDELLFVGISPAAILCVNWQSGKLVDVYNYTDDTRIAVHGLKVMENKN
jgi:hypothetical protein